LNSVAVMGGTLQQQKATLPRVCATCKWALTPPLSLTARSLMRINRHSKHLFQTYVLICLSPCALLIQELHWKAQEEKKTKVSSCLELTRHDSSTKDLHPRAAVSLGPSNHTGRKPLQQTIRGGNPYNKPYGEATPTTNPIMSLGNTGGDSVQL